jgi:ABC transporter related protein
VLEMKNVSGGYGRKQVLYNIDAAFESGRITSIIGKNGCGKSTLLQMCCGLLTPSEGSITIDGVNIASIKHADLAKKISYLSQSHSAGSITVRSLVSHGRFPYLGYPRKYSSEDKRKIADAMELAEVTDIADKYANELSGGQLQRAYIAMLLAQDTDIMLLDEPATYLDMSSQLELMELAVKLKNAGKTIVMVVHDINTALIYSDNIIAMDSGRIIETGSPRHISQSEAVQDSLGIEIIYDENVKQYFFRKAAKEGMTVK